MTKYLSFNLLLVLIMLSAGQLFAQPKAGFIADTTGGLIGDGIELTLEFKSEKRHDVIFPSEEELLPQGMEILESSTDSVVKDTEFVVRKKYTVTSFDSSDYTLGPYTLIYKKKDIDDPFAIKTDSLNITFTTVAVDTSKPVKDIKPIIDISPSILKYILYALIALAVIAGLIYLWIYFQKHKKEPKAIVPKKPEIPAHTEALNALKKLENEKLWQQGEIKRFHIKLTDIVRRYLLRRFDFNAPDMVTEDILRLFKTKTQEEELWDGLEHILKTADLAKFAKFKPHAIENEKSMEMAFDLVRGTLPKEDNSGNEQNGEEK